MAMRPSTVLFLLTVALVIVSIASKRIIRKGKPNPSKNKDSDKNKAFKKEETEDESDDNSENEYSDEESDDGRSNRDSKEVEEGSDITEESEDDEESDEDEGDNESVVEAKEDDSIDVAVASDVFKGESRKELEEKGIFYSVDDIKAFFKGSEFKGDAEIDNLLKRFINSEVQAHEKLEANKHKPLQPFYVVEGVNPDARRKIAQTLAHRLKGLYLVNQPRVILGPLPKYDGAKKAYYALSKYAIANKVLMSLFHTPVVIESYWTEHTSYIMSKVWDKASKLPTPGTEVYRFPEDMLQPNVTFAIFNTPQLRLGQTPSRNYLQEQRQLLVYKRIMGPKIHVVRFPESPKQISHKIDLYLLGQGPDRAADTFEITLAE